MGSASLFRCLRLQKRRVLLGSVGMYGGYLCGYVWGEQRGRILARLSMILLRALATSIANGMDEGADRTVSRRCMKVPIRDCTADRESGHGVRGGARPSAAVSAEDRGTNRRPFPEDYERDRDAAITGFGSR